jgi:hypothetical protein
LYRVWRSGVPCSSEGVWRVMCERRALEVRTGSWTGRRACAAYAGRVWCRVCRACSERASPAQPGPSDRAHRTLAAVARVVVQRPSSVACPGRVESRRRPGALGVEGDETETAPRTTTRHDRSNDRRIIGEPRHDSQPTVSTFHRRAFLFFGVTTRIYLRRAPQAKHALIGGPGALAG